jgi:hypothetical protein
MNLQAEAVLSYGSSWIEFRASKHGQFVISDFAAIIKSADIYKSHQRLSIFRDQILQN